MSKVDMFLDDDDIASANASQQYFFKPPSDAVLKGNLDDPGDEKARASWVQELEVVESKLYEDQTKGEHTYPCLTYELKLQVPAHALRPTGEADPNAGRSTTFWYRMVYALAPDGRKLALKDKNHPKFKANSFNLGRLNGILRSIWGSSVFPSGTRVNLADYYYAEGSAIPAVTGKKIVAYIEQSKWNGKRRDELTDFIPFELQNA
jgi:hypothetical protein